MCTHTRNHIHTNGMNMLYIYLYMIICICIYAECTTVWLYERNLNTSCKFMGNMLSMELATPALNWPVAAASCLCVCVMCSTVTSKTTNIGTVTMIYDSIYIYVQICIYYIIYSYIEPIMIWIIINCDVRNNTFVNIWYVCLSLGQRRRLNSPFFSSCAAAHGLWPRGPFGALCRAWFARCGLGGLRA